MNKTVEESDEVREAFSKNEAWMQQYNATQEAIDDLWSAIHAESDPFLEKVCKLILRVIGLL